MSYTLETVIWEITSKCNINCIHCGSDCNCIEKGKELTTEECVSILEDLSDLGCKRIIYSGGEPLLRKDLGYLISIGGNLGIKSTIISNAYLVKENIDWISALNLPVIGLSIDGAKPEIHDYIRGKKGCFERLENAINLLNNNNIQISIVTTVHKLNFPQLPKIRDFILKNNIKLWQIQYGDTIGRFPKECKITEAQFWDIAKFIKETNKKYSPNELLVTGTDLFGYMNNLSNDIQDLWLGCPGGIKVLGISANGDIRACLSLQEDRYIEGNVRLRNVKDIWNDRNLFNANRKFSCSMLTGHCRDCEYNSICKGGCYRSASINGGRNNPLCLFNIEKNGYSNEYEQRKDFSEKEIFEIYNRIRPFSDYIN